MRQDNRVGQDWALGGQGDSEHILGPLIPDFTSTPYQVFCGDAWETIRRLRAGGTQFDCVVTSPPYFHQRMYGDDAREIGRENGKGGVDSFVSALVNVFKAIPLRPWASLWVNIGDKRGSEGEQLCIPECFVVAMKNAGFHRMDNVVWAKQVDLPDGKSIGRCMVEPATRRLNGNGWEPFYRFVVDPKGAWSDTCAVQVPRDRERFFHKGTVTPVEQNPYSTRMKCATSLEGRKLTNVWYVGNSREGNGHFAAYPKELVERPIVMTCPEWLVEDGGEIKPRVRIVEPTAYSEGPGRGKRAMGQYSLVESRDEGQLTHEEQKQEERRIENLREKSSRLDSARDYLARYPKSRGWTYEDKPVVGAGVVLDPFGGTGTTGEVAILLGRRFLGIDLYPDNCTRMKERCEKAFESLRNECRTGAEPR